MDSKKSINSFEIKKDRSQTMWTVILNFRENLEFKNNCTYMKYLVLFKKQFEWFLNIFLIVFYSNKYLIVIFLKNA